MPVLATTLPAASRLPQEFAPITYADAYAIGLAGPRTAAAAVQAIFGTAPGWVRGLLRLRDALVRPFGLTTFPTGARPAATAELRVGSQLGLFRVFSVSDAEVVLGHDDRHLDFRVSVWVTPPAAPARRAVLTTAVRFHNRLGRVYFALIRPFHHRVVRAMLRRGQARLAA